MISMITLAGALALFGSSIGYFIFPAAVEMGVTSMINLAENGMIYPAYMNPPLPSVAPFFLYSIKNPKEVLRGGKMEFDLQGPFVYASHIKRSNITYTQDGERVKFMTKRVMILDEAESADLDEKYWFVNPTLPSTARAIQTLILDRIPFRRISEPIVFNSANLLLDRYKERLITKRSPRQILQGKKIELLDALQRLTNRFGLNALLPPGPPENIFGVAYFQNTSIDMVEVFTGVGKTQHRFGDVYQWKGMNRLNYWTGGCNSIEGTNGELYHPFVEKGKPLKIFLANLCRTLYLDPVSVEPVEVQDGLMALEYELSNRVFQGARNNPKNKCFCHEIRTYDCQFDGLVSMSPCFFDSPLYFSRANMKGVDRRIRSLVNESTVEYNVSEKQSFYIDQTTGSILKVNLTLLGVFKLVRQPFMRDMAAIQDITYAPLFTATEQITLPYSITRPVKYLQIMMNYYRQAFVGGAAGGAILLLFKFALLK